MVGKGPAPSRAASGSAGLFEGPRGEPGVSASSEQVKVWVCQPVPAHAVSRGGGKGPSSACSGAFSCLGLLSVSLVRGLGGAGGGLCWQYPQRRQILALGAHCWKSQPLGISSPSEDVGTWPLRPSEGRRSVFPDSAYAPQRLRRARGPSSVGSSWGPSGGGADATPAFSLRCVGLSSVLGRRPLGAVQGWGVLIYRRRTDVFVDGLLAAARYSCRRCHFVFKTSGVWQELERARNFQNS